MTGENALELRGVCKRYGDFAMENLNLTLPNGCVLGVLGANGAGKSTMIRMILDLTAPDSGSITVLGRDSREGPAVREQLGVVLDDLFVSGCLSARRLGRVLAGSYRDWDARRYDALLERLDLPPEKPVRDFSRGMRMKLGIAAALSHQARLLILDEPTGGLDPLVREQVTDLFAEFSRPEDHAVLISSHIVGDLEKLCDYVAFLHRGRLLLCEEKDRLKERFGILRCPGRELDALAPGIVSGRRDSAYGAEALVLREALPRSWETAPADLEDIFLFLTKEAG